MFRATNGHDLSRTHMTSGAGVKEDLNVRHFNVAFSKLYKSQDNA